MRTRARLAVAAAILLAGPLGASAAAAEPAEPTVPVAPGAGGTRQDLGIGDWWCTIAPWTCS